MSGSKKPVTYKEAGVDTHAGAELVDRIKPKVKATFRPEVMADLGGFGALFRPELAGMERPVLVSATDGVGTKLKLAFISEQYDTVGIDLVAMCVNDLVVQGAEPLFFLDYFATGKLDVGVAEQVVGGIADGCKIAGCSLIGGETAEMPDFYTPGEFDLAGFSVGVVDQPKVIDGAKVTEGDVILGLPSSGVHSNGFSLVRRLFTEDELLHGELGSRWVDRLLTPTTIYVKPLLSLIQQVEVHALCHITGGGFYENVPRVIPEGLAAEFTWGSWPVLPLFEEIQERAAIDRREMASTFNCGVGMMVVLSAAQAEAAQAALHAAGMTSYQIGKVTTLKATEGERVRIHGI